MITHEQYLALNQVRRDGHKCGQDINLLDTLRKNLWIQKLDHFKDWPGEIAQYELTSLGRLEHNIYEKVFRYDDGLERKHPYGTCPRCWDQDENCPICLGYTADGERHFDGL